MRFLFAKPKPDYPETLGGVTLKPSTRARRMALRVDSGTGDVVLVLPPRVSLKRAESFVQEHTGWIAQQRAKRPDFRDFTDGTVVRVAGVDYTITHQSGRGVARLEDGRLIVFGAPEFLPRRVRDALKKEALRYLTELSHKKSAALGLPPAEVRIADPKTRWGSCGHDGKLMYSWRLILAPVDVIDYVVAHEVAHRKHMNHGPRFWKLCFDLCENGDGESSRAWLRTHGQELMVYR